MSDIVERLRNGKERHEWGAHYLCEKAADEIERLRTVNDLRGSALLKSDEYIFALEGRFERLRAALRRLAGEDVWMENGARWHDVGKMQDGVRKIAKEALEKD